MSMIYVKKAQLTDLPRIMTIIDDAKALLKADGSSQWQDGTPAEATLCTDIENGDCWLLMIGNQIAGTATLLTTPDPHYSQILEGAWLKPTAPYATIHRIAISNAYRGQSLSQFFFSNLISLGCQLGFQNFRIDTHELNQRMQKIAQNFDFKYTGIIYVNATEAGRRLAYELNLQ
jgi:RimJ/RimL family protein N-acetyltransferase